MTSGLAGQEGAPAAGAAKAAQIAALAREKASRTAAQKKMESSLVLALKKSRGEPPFDKHPSLPAPLAVEPGGLVLVDVDATVSEALLDHIRSLGGELVSSFPALRALRARVPLGRLEMLAARDEVQSVAPAAVPDPPFSSNNSPATGKEKTGGAPGSNSKPHPPSKRSTP